MTLRTHQDWYARVASFAPPDLAPLSAAEALEEMRLAPFEDAHRFQELARTDSERHQGMTFALVQAMSAGSQQALTLLLERCQPRIREMVRRQIGQTLRSYTDSGEVQQEVNLQLVRSLKDFVPQSDGAFIAWLYSVVRNRIAALSRSAEARPARRVAPDSLNAISQNEEGKERARNQALVGRALDELAADSPVHAQALRLQLERWPIRRIAASVGRSESATGMLLVRARQRLAPIVRRLAEGDPD